jgi:hypothetical protein
VYVHLYILSPPAFWAKEVLIGFLSWRVSFCWCLACLFVCLFICLSALVLVERRERNAKKKNEGERRESISNAVLDEKYIYFWALKY